MALETTLYSLSVAYKKLCVHPSLEHAITLVHWKRMCVHPSLEHAITLVHCKKYARASFSAACHHTCALQQICACIVLWNMQSLLCTANNMCVHRSLEHVITLQYDTIWYYMQIWYYMILFGFIWYNMILCKYDTTWYYMQIWYYMKLFGFIWYYMVL